MIADLAECDLALEVDDENVSPSKLAIMRLRAKLLSEHLGVPIETFEERYARTGRLIDTIELLRGGERTLAPLERRVPEWLDLLVPDSPVLDPRGPCRLHRGFQRYFPNFFSLISRSVPWLGRFKLVTFFLILTSLLVVWKFTPLAAWIQPGKISNALKLISAHPLSPLAVVGMYVVAGFLMIPVTTLIVATALTYETQLAFLTAMAGALVSGAVAYWVGSRFGSEQISRLSNSWLKRVKEKIAGGGWLAMAVVRLVPVAPFTIVNLVAGSMHMPFRHFMFGTLVGMLPGTLALTYLADRAVRVFLTPDLRNLFLLAVVILAFYAAIRLIQHFVTSKTA